MPLPPIATGLLIFAALSCASLPAVNQASSTPKVSVGVVGRIEQQVLPGGPLRARPIEDDRQPIVIRLTGVFPHGDSYRYDIEYYALEPGVYDLRDYLERVDGSATDDLPSLPVEITSRLPPGQIEPHVLDPRSPVWLGGYRLAIMLVAALWVSILAVLLLAGRKKRRAADADRSMTLADYLKPRIEAAIEGRLDPRQHAELERMLIALWRRRLQLENVDATTAIQQLRVHPQAGPLIQRLEQWMHGPEDIQRADLAALLEPYRDLPAAERTGLPAGPDSH